ncbi:MAG: hypothetical protein J07HX64_02831 [halophilic archaeon J07HX64]|jgi:Protein of unknown function (DUF3179).|nr:MAG: hypothetical protein J07HX64_02831 [halophilic archaeon J07HX64]
MKRLDRPGLTRRRLLALGTAGGVALAGCLSDSDSDSDNRSRPEPESEPEPGNVTATQDGGVATDPAAALDLPVDDSELRRGAGEDSIPAIVDPTFESDWSGLTVEYTDSFSGQQTIEPRLEPDDSVIGVTRDGEARAYPFRVLNWHEIVNDDFGGPLLVTYCPLCRSAVTTERRVDGETTVFGVSGLLYRNALVMYDEATDSLWSQLAARAIQGPMTGESLDLERTTITTWEAWQADHPETVVLRPPPDSSTVVGDNATRNYNRNPYDGYGESSRTGLAGDFDGDRLDAKAEVIGIASNGVARAYPATTLETEGIVEDSVGGLPVVVTTTADGTPVAWVREVDGEVLSFSGDGDHLSAGGSRWRRTTGVAVDGPYGGQQLAQANAISPHFWFAWLDIHPDSGLYAGNG